MTGESMLELAVMICQCYGFIGVLVLGYLFWFMRQNEIGPGDLLTQLDEKLLIMASGRKPSDTQVIGFFLIYCVLAWPRVLIIMFGEK
jgi:hypothetical protein